MFNVTPTNSYPGFEATSYRAQANRNMSRAGLEAHFGADTINILTRPDGTIDKSHIRELFRVEGVPPADALVTKRRRSSIADELIRYSNNLSSELNMFKDQLKNASPFSMGSGTGLDLFG